MKKDGPDEEHAMKKIVHLGTSSKVTTAGETTSYGAGGIDVWLIKTDSNGNA